MGNRHNLKNLTKTCVRFVLVTSVLSILGYSLFQQLFTSEYENVARDTWILYTVLKREVLSKRSDGKKT